MPTNRLVVKEEVETYAEVLLKSACDSNGTDCVLETRDQLEQIIGFIRSDMKLNAAVQNPDYTPQQRNDLVRAVFGQMNPVVVDVLAVMAERLDMSLIDRVYELYSRKLEAELGVAIVDVTTVVPLDDNLRKVISTKVQNDLNKQVILREHVDKSILGGVVLATNGKKIDASMVSQLAHARTVLETTTIGGEC